MLVIHYLLRVRMATRTVRNPAASNDLKRAASIAGSDLARLSEHLRD
jgi:hypothetical protein